MTTETKQIDEGGPAYPVPMWTRQADGQPMAATEFGLGGMTRRQWLAGMAMQGYISNREQCANMTHEQVAENSWRDADAMLAARKGATK